MTVGMWSWKSKSSKECVTTHRPNGLALKMDGARAEGPYPAVVAMPPLKQAEPGRNE